MELRRAEPEGAGEVMVRLAPGGDGIIDHHVYASASLTAEGGSYTLTGQNVSLEVGHNLAVGHGTYALTGQDVSLSVA